MKKTFKCLLEKTGVEQIVKYNHGMDQEELENLFMLMDLNADGFIDHNEVSEFLRQYVTLSTEREVAFLMNVIDVDQDGRISFLDFCKFFNMSVEE